MHIGRIQPLLIGLSFFRCILLIHNHHTIFGCTAPGSAARAAQGLKSAWVSEANTPPVAPGRKPTDRRSRVARWNDAVRTLTDLHSLPASLRDSPTAERRPK